jgi:hypothetical protein
LSDGTLCSAKNEGHGPKNEWASGHHGDDYGNGSQLAAAVIANGNVR